MAGLAAAGEFDNTASAVAEGAPCLREAFLRSAGDVYRFLLVRLGGDRDAAGELLQECCRHAWAHGKPPVDPDAWPAWFCGIARNLVRRHWRQRRRARCREAGDFELARPLVCEPLPDEVLAREETRGALMLAISEMSEKDQDLLFAFYFDGRSSASIAAELRTTIKAVETRLRRARGRLRKILSTKGAT